MIARMEQAANEAGTVREKMVAVGMEYLRFAKAHSDYFTVIFKAGLDKSKYPEVERRGKETFGVILRLAEELERTPELGAQRAVSCWALVHGLATLTADGAPATAVEDDGDQTAYARRLLERFVNQPYR